MAPPPTPSAPPGRGATVNPANRFDRLTVEADPDYVEFDYDASFGARLHGEGIFAEQIKRLFAVSARRAGLNEKRIALSAAHFRRPGGVQLELLEKDCRAERLDG